MREFIKKIPINLILNFVAFSFWVYIMFSAEFCIQLKHNLFNYFILIPFVLFILRLCMFFKNPKSSNPLFLSLFNLLLSLKFIYILKKNPSDWTQAYSFIYIQKKSIYCEPILLTNPINSFVEVETPISEISEINDSEILSASTINADMQTVLILTGVIIGIVVVGYISYLVYTSYFVGAAAASIPVAVENIPSSASSVVENIPISPVVESIPSSVSPVLSSALESIPEITSKIATEVQLNPVNPEKIFEFCQYDLEVINLVRNFFFRIKLHDPTFTAEEMGYVVQLCIGCKFIDPKNKPIQELIWEITDMVQNFPVF